MASSSNTSHTLQELAHYLGAELRGDGQCVIGGIAALDKAQSGQISFLTTPKYKAFLQTTQASAVIISAKDAEAFAGNCLVMDNPYLGYAKVATLFVPKSSTPAGIHPTAVVGEHCQIASTAKIAAHCTLGNHVTIGEHVVIGAGSVMGDHTVVGEHTELYPNVTLYHQVTVGKKVIIHSGAVIGADGFGMANDKGVWFKIPQLAGVVIGDNVEIGANTTIDRGALKDTVIEDGVKLDNHIQIGHNVRIGAHTAIAGMTAIGGSTTVGKYCIMGGGVAIADNITIVDQVILTAKAEVPCDILKPGVYSSGMPAEPNLQWRKNITRFTQLDDIARRLKKLEKHL